MPFVAGFQSPFTGTRLPITAATKYSPSTSNGQPISARNALPMLLMRNSFKCNQFPWLILCMFTTHRRRVQMPTGQFRKIGMRLVRTSMRCGIICLRGNPKCCRAGRRDAFLRGVDVLKLEKPGIPDYRELNARLMAATGWQVVAVPGLVPDDVFFDHLANRRFPAGNFIRTPDQIDYLQEPDVFHDVFGHVPMLADPVFADYMVAYGKGGLRSWALARCTSWRGSIGTRLNLA